MNFKQVVNIINDVSISHPNVKEFNEGDIYENLNSGEHKYPAINLTTQSIQTVDEDMMQMNCTLFYVDRLLQDASNKIDIQAIGVEVLKQLQYKIESNIGISGSTQFTYTMFTEQFADLCAGVYVQMQIVYPADLDCDIYTAY